MKTFAVAVAALCSIASAFPLTLNPFAVQAPPPAGTQLYQLQSRSTVTALNNQWVALKTGASTYGLASAQAAATKFFVRIYEPTGTYAFYSGDDSRQLALKGSSSVLLDVVDMTDIRIPAGMLMEWATFTMTNNLLGVSDGSALTNRSFVAVQATGGYSLGFYDGVSNTTAAITPITLAIVKTT